MVCGWIDVQNWTILLQNWMLPELQSKLLAMQLKSSRYAEKDESHTDPQI